MARKNYSEEFRRQAVDLYESTAGATVRGIAEDLGIERVNRKRVARVMRQERIRGYRRRRRVATTVPEPAHQRVPDLLRRDFTAAAINERYVGDITYLPLADGSNLYLATVIDCHSRRLVGWSLAGHMRTELVLDALQAAAGTRGGLRGATTLPPTTRCCNDPLNSPFTPQRITLSCAPGSA